MNRGGLPGRWTPWRSFSLYSWHLNLAYIVDGLDAKFCILPRFYLPSIFPAIAVRSTVSKLLSPLRSYRFTTDQSASAEEMP